MHLLYVLPVFIVIGSLYLLFMLRGARGDSAQGRPDDTEPEELRGPHQHLHRRGSGTSAPLPTPSETDRNLPGSPVV